MKTLKKIPVKVKHIIQNPGWDKLEEHVIYISNEYELALHLCLCGCKEPVCTPFTKTFEGDEHGWNISENEKGVTFTPSILNPYCPNKYHYIITDGIANVV